MGFDTESQNLCVYIKYTICKVRKRFLDFNKKKDIIQIRIVLNMIKIRYERNYRTYISENEWELFIKVFVYNVKMRYYSKKMQ